MKIFRNLKNETVIVPNDYSVATDFDEALAAVAFMISHGKSKGGVFAFTEWDYWDGLYSNYEPKDCEITIPGINREEAAPEYKERLVKWLDNIIKFATIVPKNEETTPRFILW